MVKMLRAVIRVPLMTPIALLAIIIKPGYADGPPPITTATIKPDLPAEVVDGAGNPLAVAQSALPIDFFDDFSWRSFVALMWPAKPDVRGVADTMKQVSDITGPRVFEMWKSAYEAVPAKGADPTDWTSFDGKTPCPDVSETGSGKARILGSFTKFGDISEADFGTLAGALVCRNATYAHYEIKVNRAEFNFILTNKLYEREVIDALASPLSFTNGSTEVKVAWREFRASEGPEVRNRYYRMTAHVLNYKTGMCDQRELGLIGFHIVHKTPLRPQWVWSSFEHVDNVPAIGQVPPLGAKLRSTTPRFLKCSTQPSHQIQSRTRRT